jgi:hypothetical protein
MSGTRARRGRIIAMGVCLALALLLAAAGEARAAKYSVAQCGWHIGADADWADTTGGAKFRPDSYCAAPADADPFDGVHLKSFTKEGQPTVSGTRFARWRWAAPPGTAITRVSGTWWQALHDGMEQRIGVETGGGFDVFADAAATNVSPRDFVAGFGGASALEDRLLCARAESKSCSLESQSWSGLRALTITLEDDAPPGAAVGGELVSGGWRRGGQSLSVAGSDVGGGVRFDETLLDGARVALSEFPCAMAMIGGEWRATQMRPCELSAAAGQSVATTAFSDGPHPLVECATDFAGNAACSGAHTVLIDNNAPAHVRSAALAGGESWHRVNDFDLGWEDPDQGAASPLAGASWWIVGPGGYDTGAHFSPGRGLTQLQNLTLPHAGAYSLSIWLRDEAGNESPGNAVTVPLLFDDEAPGVAFEADAGGGLPDAIRADVEDPLSGPASGEIDYRRLGSEHWQELPSKLISGAAADQAQLAAPLPGSLSPGTYVFRAQAADRAGNTATSTRRIDGTEMALRVTPPPADQRPAVPRQKTRIFAHLGWRKRHGSTLTIPFGATARISGRLLDADGAGLGDRRLRVVARSSHGALAGRFDATAETGDHGGFTLTLPPGTSRRVTVAFAGEERLEPARRTPLSLRVQSGVSFHAAPLELRTGQAVRLWGRVRARGAPLPRRGKLVAVQYLETATGRWRPVLVTRSDHAGHFQARYRFRYLRGRARIRLRAVALPEERWPYAPGASPAVSVEVNG